MLAVSPASASAPPITANSICREADGFAGTAGAAAAGGPGGVSTTVLASVVASAAELESVASAVVCSGAAASGANVVATGAGAVSPGAAAAGAAKEGAAGAMAFSGDGQRAETAEPRGSAGGGAATGALARGTRPGTGAATMFSRDCGIGYSACASSTERGGFALVCAAAFGAGSDSSAGATCAALPSWPRKYQQCRLVPCSIR